jgi:thiamine pyrophosphate-dependent acetolactate synthase large subunit-like protein
MTQTHGSATLRSIQLIADCKQAVPINVHSKEGSWPRLSVMDCDTLFMVGTSLPYIEFLPKPGDARGVQIDNGSARIGLCYPIEAGLVGDCRNTLQELLGLR